MNLLITFSGGKTSAYMTKWLLEHKRADYDEIAVVFANTGQENDKTLKFVNACDKAWNLGVVWVEAKVDFENRKGSVHKIVDFDNASRTGKPFEDMIKKYGIPNNSYPHCTRELKLNPINSYIKSLGWKKKSYETAIGIRFDEMDRVNSKMNELQIIYPLCEEHPRTKENIEVWWEKQPFNLKLYEHEGNCTWCWKKSRRKLLTLAKHTPEIFEFPIRMENLYARNGPKDNLPTEDRVFFRGFTSGKTMLSESKKPFKEFDPTLAKRQRDLNFELVMDSANGCSESCEVY